MKPSANGRHAVLFDLDGTFVDSAPDMAAALNRVLDRHGKPAQPLTQVRPQVSHGARGMIQVGFGLYPGDEGYVPLREAFLDEYRQNLCVETQPFPGIMELVSWLESRHLTWGIVTNKATRFTLPIVEQLGIASRAACIVCGDTCERAKPHPDPLLRAAELIDITPDRCFYVGDDERDIQAANAAGMIGVVALYGYLGTGKHPSEWGASASITEPASMTALLENLSLADKA